MRGLVLKKTGDVYEFNPVQNAWTLKNIMPNSRKWSNHSSAEANNLIFMFEDSGTNSLVYDPASNQWLFLTDPVPTSYFDRTASAVGDNLYLMGGLNLNAQKFVGTNYELVPDYTGSSSDAWNLKAPMPTGRRGLTSAVVNNKIYAIGGFNFDQEQRTVEEYNPASNTWRTVTSMSLHREGPASAVVDGKIYIIGGRKDNDVLATVEEYDPQKE